MSERYVSLHVEKTAGISMRRFFDQRYGPENVYHYIPGEGFIRSDNDPTVARLNPQVDRIKRVLVQAPGVYRVLRKLLHATEKKEVLRDLPDDFRVIHGHFTYEQMRAVPGTFVTVMREPIERTASHYRYWGEQYNKGADTPAWFKPKMTFENFALHEEMVNFHHARIGSSLEPYGHVGVVKQLRTYCNYFDPQESVPLQHLNPSGKKHFEPCSEATREKICEAYFLDYELYENALERVDMK